MSDTPSILNEIVNKRQERLTALAEYYSIAQLQEDIAAQTERPTRSLYQALGRVDKGFILECKKASPSKGLIREHFDPVAIAQAYQPYAAAISVLTEPDYFQGDFAYLQAVSQQVQIPVLCKDFIVEPLQVYLARYFGADAILLMLSILSDERYQQLSSLAAELNLEVLTEVSNPAEMQRAARLLASHPRPVIGINHRNLHDLSMDTQRSEILAPMAPPQARLVAESGIHSHTQVRDMGAHVDGFLVGSHLTAQPDISLACRQLIVGGHKVCGLTNGPDALMALTAGAQFGGLIFAPRSPRCVNLKTAQSICSQVPGLQYVAVMTAHDLTELLSVADNLPLTAIQLHDQQDLSLVQALKESRPQLQVWYALNMSELTAPLSDVMVTLQRAGVDRILLDQGRGGSGQAFDWSVLSQIAPTQRQHVMLAGGLNLTNMRAAAQQPVAGLDINSGAEMTAGRKDAAKLRQIFSIIQQVFRAPNTAESDINTHDRIATQETSV